MKITLVLALAVLSFPLSGIAQTKKKDVKPPVPAVAPATPAPKPADSKTDIKPATPAEKAKELDAPKDFIDNFGALLALDQQRQELSSEVAALQKLESSKQQELVSKIPQGYTFDREKGKFELVPVPVKTETLDPAKK